MNSRYDNASTNFLELEVNVSRKISFLPDVEVCCFLFAVRKSLNKVARPGEYTEIFETA